MMKKILLTGSGGFLASRFFEYYRDDYDFILLNRNSIDMTDERAVFDLFQSENIDIVFHTAAMADIAQCQNDPELARRTNVLAAANMAKGCALKNSVLVFAGSDQIFKANTAAGPYSEDTAPRLGTVYAETKLAAENEIKRLTDRHYILRLTWLFSMPERRKRNKGIMVNILKSLMSDTPVALNANDFRGISYVYEVIENFRKILKTPFGTYHFGSENELSVYEIGLATARALSPPSRAEKTIRRASGDPCDLRLSTRKARDCGIRFSDSADAVERCVAEFM